MRPVESVLSVKQQCLFYGYTIIESGIDFSKVTIDLDVKPPENNDHGTFE
jgi:hypothetical protein